MPSFVWKGRTRAGGTVEGVLIADNRRAAEMAVRRQNPQVIQVTNVREKGKEIPLIPRLPRRISEKRIAVFTRQFSVMLDAGLPLVQCLEILGEQEDNPRFAQIIEQVRSDVESGSSLAEAMAKHPKAFNTLFVSMIAAGEAGRASHDRPRRQPHRRHQDLPQRLTVVGDARLAIEAAVELVQREVGPGVQLFARVDVGRDGLVVAAPCEQGPCCQKSENCFSHIGHDYSFLGFFAI